MDLAVAMSETSRLRFDALEEGGDEVCQTFSAMDLVGLIPIGFGLGFALDLV